MAMVAIFCLENMRLENSVNTTVKTRYKKHFYKKLSRYKKLFGDDQLFTK